jgi:16S rRNA (adenine1518-N6/adenine1519-N6)-dimethyltransferase
MSDSNVDTPEGQPPDPKSLLQEAGLFAKKSFGQNFLRDTKVHERVARALEASPDDTIVELGAGLGTLTWFLAQTGARVEAVERDRDLVPVLRRVFSPYPRVTIHEADAKQVDYERFVPKTGKLRVAGNIPYQLTSPLIFSLFEQRAHVAFVSLLVQKEVADRIVAPEGSKTYGLLSVILGSVASVRRVCVVPRGAFHPAPRVDSAVIAWQPKDVAVDDALLVEVARAAFQQRRKTLKNALSRFGPEMLQALASVGIDDMRRPETVSPADFVRLVTAYAAMSSKS